MSFDFSLETLRTLVGLASFVFGLVLIFVARPQPEARAIMAWGGAFLLNAPLELAGILHEHGVLLAGYVSDVLYVAMMPLFIAGIFIYLQRPVPSGLLAASAILVLIWLVHGRLSAAPELWTILPRAIISTGAYAALGLAALTTWRLNRSWEEASLAGAAFACAATFGAFLPARHIYGEGAEIAITLARPILQLLLGIILIILVQMRTAARLRAEACERHAAEQRARESEHRFRTVLDHMPIAVFLKANNRYVLANRELARWVRLPQQELETMTDLELFGRLGWPTENLRRTQRLQAQVFETGVPDVCEITVPFADGRLHDLLLATFPVDGTDGATAAVGIAATDISEFKRMQRQLGEAQKMDALGRLASGIAHDFNNIVGAITGFARFIVQDAPPESSIRKHAERILIGSERAKNLIRQISSFSRSRAIERQRVEVPALLSETLDLMRVTVPGSVAIEIAPAPPDLAIDGDATQIGQVLFNVCLNAAEALAGRPGRIFITTEAVTGQEAIRRLRGKGTTLEPARDGRRVVGGLDRARDYAVVRVADTGLGMPPEILERIFEPFFTTKLKGTSSGLGLAVAHSVVASHGGAIVVTSRPGAGTRFEIWLPRATGPAPQRPSDAEARSESGRGRIIIVDDDDDFGDMAATALDRLGYETAVVSGAADALDVITDDPSLWDAVLTDHMMPEISGLELIARIKAQRPDLPCILCTGGAALAEISAREAGADVYLTKPIDPMALGRVMRHVLRRS